MNKTFASVFWIVANGYKFVWPLIGNGIFNNKDIILKLLSRNK